MPRSMTTPRSSSVRTKRSSSPMAGSPGTSRGKPKTKWPTSLVGRTRPPRNGCVGSSVLPSTMQLEQEFDDERMTVWRLRRTEGEAPPELDSTVLDIDTKTEEVFRD